MARSQVQICNAALDELPSATIQTIDDPDDLGARACKRRYAGVLEDLLGEHDYDAAVRRVVMAPVANDRPGEWGYAYAMPDNVASPKRVLPNYAASFVADNYVILPGQQAWVGFYPDNMGAPYRIAGNKVYCHVPAAVMEYITTDVTLAYFRPLFFRAFELELAARICMPVTKDSKRQKELIAMAEVQRQRAMADDLNSSPDRTFDFVSEEAMVRIGGLPVPYAGMGAR